MPRSRAFRNAVEMRPRFLTADCDHPRPCIQFSTIRSLADRARWGRPRSGRPPIPSRLLRPQRQLTKIRNRLPFGIIAITGALPGVPRRNSEAEPTSCRRPSAPINTAPHNPPLAVSTARSPSNSRPPRPARTSRDRMRCRDEPDARATPISSEGSALSAVRF